MSLTELAAVPVAIKKKAGARSEMMLKHRTTEQWMRIGFILLVLVSMICTLLIVVAKLR